MRGLQKREVVNTFADSLSCRIFSFIGFGHDGDFAGRPPVLPFQLCANFMGGLPVVNLDVCFKQLFAVF